MLPLDCEMSGGGLALYSLVLSGNPAQQIDQLCADDLEALEFARAYCSDCDVEVYDDDCRLVARIKKGDEPLSVRDRHSG